MNKRFVRIKCRPAHGSEVCRFQIMLDAILDGDKLLSMPWLGTATFQGMYPFKMDIKGEIDFGQGYSGPNRFWQTNIFDRIIRSGELFSISGMDENNKTRECIYEIHDVQTVLRQI